MSEHELAHVPEHVVASEPIRVVIVDDHPAVRAGLTTMLLSEEDMMVVGVAATGEEALRICVDVHPQVVLMDLKLPGMDGSTAIAELRRRDPTIQILVLTTFPDEHLVQEALQAGATGYLLKEADARALVEAIRSTATGQLILAPAATQALIRSVTAAPSRQQARMPVQLSEREHEVLVRVVAGEETQEIAQELVIAPSTVKYHLKQLYSKLGVSNRAELVREALRRRLVE
jgi:NarL family two-component system response regulator LiaR